MKTSKKSQNPRERGLDFKMPENPEKILGFHGYFTIGIFSGFSAKVRDSEFFQSRNFNPWESGFFFISGFSPRSRDYSEHFLSLGLGFFFRGMGIATKSQLCL